MAGQVTVVVLWLRSVALGVALSGAMSACGMTGRDGRAAPVVGSETATVRQGPSGVVSYIDRQDTSGGTAPRLVVLVSVDGLAPYVRVGARTPVLDRLARAGTSFDNAFTVVPSITLTSHVSMLSGVLPDRHRVLWNFYDPSRTLHTPTVFTHCRSHQLRCAIFAGKEKFLHFAEAEPGVQHFEYQPGAGMVLDRATRYIADKRPDFVFILLAEVDVAGHEFGWNSPEQVVAIEGIDRGLGELSATLDGSSRPVTLIVTSDHGGHGRSHGEDSPQDRTIPWIGYGDAIDRRGITSNARPVSTLDTAATVLALLGVAVPTEMQGKVVALQNAQSNADRVHTEDGRGTQPR